MTLLQRHLSQNADRISASVRQSHVQKTLKTRNKKKKHFGTATACSHSHINMYHTGYNMRCGFPAVVVFVVVVWDASFTKCMSAL